MAFKCETPPKETGISPGAQSRELGAPDHRTAELPLSSVTTWDPAHGYLIHPHLDVAAAHVVAMGGGLTVTPGRPIMVTHTGPARILSSPSPLTLAEEHAALEQARAASR